MAKKSSKLADLPPLRRLARGKANKMVIEAQMLADRSAYLEAIVKDLLKVYHQALREPNPSPEMGEVLANVRAHGDRSMKGVPSRLTAAFKDYVLDAATVYARRGYTDYAICAAFGVPRQLFLEWQRKRKRKLPQRPSTAGRLMKRTKLGYQVPLEPAAQYELEEMVRGADDPTVRAEMAEARRIDSPSPAKARLPYVPNDLGTMTVDAPSPSEGQDPLFDLPEDLL